MTRRDGFKQDLIIKHKSDLIASNYILFLLYEEIKPKLNESSTGELQQKLALIDERFRQQCLEQKGSFRALKAKILTILKKKPSDTVDASPKLISLLAPYQGSGAALPDDKAFQAIDVALRESKQDPEFTGIPFRDIVQSIDNLFGDHAAESKLATKPTLANLEAIEADFRKECQESKGSFNDVMKQAELVLTNQESKASKEFKALKPLAQALKDRRESLTYDEYITLDENARSLKIREFAGISFKLVRIRLYAIMKEMDDQPAPVSQPRTKPKIIEDFPTYCPAEDSDRKSFCSALLSSVCAGADLNLYTLIKVAVRTKSITPLYIYMEPFYKPDYKDEDRAALLRVIKSIDGDIFDPLNRGGVNLLLEMLEIDSYRHPELKKAITSIVAMDSKAYINYFKTLLLSSTPIKIIYGFILNDVPNFLKYYEEISLNLQGFMKLAGVFEECRRQVVRNGVSPAASDLLKATPQVLAAIFNNSTGSIFGASDISEKDQRNIFYNLLKRGMQFDFLMRLYHSSKGGKKWEIQAHEELTLLLIKEPHNLKPGQLLWESMQFMSDIFSGINPDSKDSKLINKLPSQDDQSEKIKQIIAVFSRNPRSDFNAMSSAFSYLSICLLKHRELFPKAIIAPHLIHLLDIIGRKQEPCITFARAILTAPFISPKSDALKQNLRAELAALLPPKLRDVIAQLVIEEPKLEEAKREMEQPVEQVVDLLENKEISEPASQSIGRSSLSSPVKVSTGPTHLPSPVSSAPSLFGQARPVSLSTELRQKLQERTVVSDPPSEALLEVKQSLPLSSAPTEDSDEKLRTQLYEIIRTQADKIQSDKLDCKALRRYADQAQKKGLFSEALELQVFEHEAQREELLTALDQDLKEVPDSGALTPHQEVLTALRTVQQSLKETVSKIQALHTKEQKSYAPATAASVHQFTDAQWEKIELFKKALELILSDHFVQHIAVARKLAKAKLNKPTQLIVGGVAFAVGQLLPVPLVGAVVSEGVNWVIQRYKRAESSELSFGMSSVSEAALLVENIVALTACSYQLMISRLHPLAIEVFASSLVKRMAQCPPLEGVSADEKLAQHLVMYCSTHETVDDSLYSLAEDSQVVAFHSKGSYCYVTVNDICRNSGMLDFDMERQRYYHWPSSAPAFQGLPRYVSTYERTARKLERSTVWQNHLPISPLSLQNNQLLEKIKRLESQLRQAHVQCTVLQEENRRLGEGGRRSTGPGLFDGSSSAGINTQAHAATVNIR